MTISETLTEGKRLLAAPCAKAFIDTPSLDAVLLLAKTLKLSKEILLLRGNENISEQDREKFLKFLDRRRHGECVAYILGYKEFRGLSFAVNPSVLVPRPDTETLVEAAIEYIDKAPLTLLDLCTGSGAVAISLKNERPFLAVTATDISHDALEVAKANAARILENKVSQNVLFIKSDLFENINAQYDIIVSNPPYIPSNELASLAPEIKQEPSLALDGWKDGLELIQKIISQARTYLKPGGALLLEAASAQMMPIKTLLENQKFCYIKIHKDLAGKDRVISARRL